MAVAVEPHEPSNVPRVNGTGGSRPDSLPSAPEERDRSAEALRHSLAVLRRQIALIVAIAVLVPVVAVGATFFQEDRYVASATLLFRSAPLQQVDLFGTQPPDQSGSQNADREQATNLRLVTLPVVADRTARAVPQLGLSSDQIRNDVRIQADGNSSLISISASTGDANRSATLANAFAKQYISFRKQSDSAQFLQAREMIDGLLARLPEAQREGSRPASLRTRSSNLTLAASLQGGNADRPLIAERTAERAIGSRDRRPERGSYRVPP
jgi:uncharacterized protein involved in exopolysaccharide biosynthesis